MLNSKRWCDIIIQLFFFIHKGVNVTPKKTLNNIWRFELAISRLNMICAFFPKNGRIVILNFDFVRFPHLTRYFRVCNTRNPSQPVISMLNAFIHLWEEELTFKMTTSQSSVHCWRVCLYIPCLSLDRAMYLSCWNY